jgi:hypothetical protein
MKSLLGIASVLLAGMWVAASPAVAAPRTA